MPKTSFYFAATHGLGKKFLLVEKIPQMNFLESFFYIAPWQSELIGMCKSFMLDSGAYSFAYGSRQKVNMTEYFDMYKRYIKDKNIELFFELDIDELVGYDKVLDYRKELEGFVGRRCIPVWHVNRGKNEWFRMCDEYDYVAIGGIADKGRASIEKYIPWFTREAHKSGTKVHGLGYCPLDTEKLKKTGFDSVDGAAWTYGNIGAYVEYFDGRTMKRKYVPDGKRLSSNVRYHNMMEWLKMAKHLEK